MPSVTVTKDSSSNASSIDSVSSSKRIKKGPKELSIANNVATFDTNTCTVIDRYLCCQVFSRAGD